MKRILILLPLLLLFGMRPGLAQGQFDLRTTPTNVIKTGRSEVLGRIILAAAPSCGTAADTLCTTTAGTIQVLYNGVGIDNSGSAGTAVNVTEAGVSRADVGAAGIEISTNRAAATLLGPTASFTVSNTVSGGVVSMPILAGVDLAAGDFIAVDGVRGRIDISPGNTPAGSPGTDILAFLTASPSTIAAFQPTSEVVARSADGLVVVVTPQTFLQCIGAVPTLTVSLREGFNSAFVQHVTSLAGTVVPTDARPPFGGTSNTRFNIVVTGLPTGVVVTWPAAVTDATVLLGGGGTTSTIQLRVQTATGSRAVYEFVSGFPGGAATQGIADVTLQRFNVVPATVTIPAAGLFGTATAQAQLNPPLVAGEVAFTLTSAPTTPAAAFRPRFNDPLSPSPAANFLSVQSCVGVLGEASAVGVDGLTAATSGTGVYGLASANSGSTVGVKGVVESSSGTAGVFDNTLGGDIIVARVNAVNKFRADGTGAVFATAYNTGGADLAESVESLGEKDAYEPGDVLVIDPTGSRRVALAAEAYSTRVAGIYSTKPGVLATPYEMDDPRLAREIPVAVVGVVPCKVSAENGPIEIGDMLVASATPGHAMKATDRARMLGAVVGKALEPLRQGTGVIQVLVTLQ